MPYLGLGSVTAATLAGHHLERRPAVQVLSWDDTDNHIDCEEKLPESVWPLLWRALGEAHGFVVVRPRSFDSIGDGGNNSNLLQRWASPTSDA